MNSYHPSAHLAPKAKGDPTTEPKLSVREGSGELMSGETSIGGGRMTGVGSAAPLKCKTAVGLIPRDIARPDSEDVTAD